MIDDQEYYQLRKKSFDHAVDYYDQYRPTFSPELFQKLNQYINKKTYHILEFGCGTGQSTSHLLKLGQNLKAIDISPNMIAKLKENFKGISHLEAEVLPFEQVEGEYDLIYASQAKHWIPNETLYQKSFSLLKEDGVICWTRNNLEHQNKEIRAGLDELYKTCFPQINKKTKKIYNPYESKNQVHEEIEGSSYFFDAESFTFPVEKTLSTQEYIGLMKSQSDHIIYADKLEPLYSGMKSLFQEFDNKIPVVYEGQMTVARRNGAQ